MGLNLLWEWGRSKLKQNDYVLFSCVGSTDPIRNNYDGGLLHIIRYFRPHAVMIFFSQEMEERERKDGRFTKAVQLLAEKINLKIEIKEIYSGIKDVHNFDAYIGKFEPCFEELHRDYQSSAILVNVSSGTPQMQAMLCLNIVVSSKNLIPVQVKTPEDAANKSKVAGEEYDVENEFLNDLDNEEDAPNRCSIPDIFSFKRTIAQGQLLSLINSYKYESALLILENHNLLSNQRLITLIQHMIERMNLNDKKAKKLAKKIAACYPSFDFYPVKDVKCSEFCEYLNVLKAYQKTGQYTDFTLRLNPLVTNLQTAFLENVLAFDVDSIIKEMDDGGKKVNIHRFQRVDSKMLDYVNKNFYEGCFRDGSLLNMRLQNAIISYLLLDRNDPKLNCISAFFAAVEKLNQKLRNAAAHQLVGVGKEEIIAFSGLTPFKIVECLENIISFIYENQCKMEVFEIYDALNQLIATEMEREL